MKISIIKQIQILFLIQSVSSSFFDNNEEKCEMDTNCALPYCNCDSASAPVSGEHLFKMPQLVVLTIDDDKLDVKSYQVYKRLFEWRRNPNGCAMRATMFVSDTFNRTSYCLVRDLYDKRFEVAVSTVNYTCPHRRCSPLPDFQPWHYTRWSEQIFNMKSRLVRYAGVARADIVGFRAPLLEPSSDLHYRIIDGDKFLYDSSLVMNTPDIIWPFTLDYKIRSPLSNNGPINSYPGLWELPVPTYNNLENKKEKCLKIWEGHCSFDRSRDGIAKFMRHHFLRAYYNSKAPVVFHLNADWLKEYVVTNKTEVMPNVGYANLEVTRIRIQKKEYRNLDGLIKFINTTLENNKDVYFVTARKAIKWMQMITRIETNNETFTDLLKELFDDEDCEGEWRRPFRGECSILDQPEPDYNTEESLELDEDVDEQMQKKLRIDNNPNSLLTILQTEVLFMNDFVLVFTVLLAVILAIIIIRDKFF